MGRIFEVRKSTMFARYDRMAKQFSRVGKEIAIAVKSAGPDVENNPALRRAVQNARAVNMPKDKVESAIKRALGKDRTDYEELMYEGYAPHGIALIIETATDNPTRTVANVRSYFNKFDGALSTSGSVSFQFKKMGVFNLAPEGLDPETLELDLIDFGLEELGEGTGENGEDVLVVRCAFNDFGKMQSGLEQKGLKTLSSEIIWLPLNVMELSGTQADDVMKLVARMEEDDDVQKVFHNLA